MDDAPNVLSKTLSVLSQWPDSTSVVLGTLIGYTLVLMVERYFLPEETDPKKLRQQKGLTFLLTWICSGAASAILWAYLDPSDKPTMRLTVSYLVSVLSFPGYPFLAKAATSLWPRLGSAWASQSKGPE